MKLGKLPQNAMSSNLAGPPFLSVAVAVKIRLHLALGEGVVCEGETNPCASLFRFPAKCRLHGDR